MKDIKNKNTEPKLKPCTHAFNPEMARNTEIDEPCDDSRG